MLIVSRRRWAGMWVAFTALMLTAIACESSSDATLDRAALAKGCKIDSDCQKPLRCAFESCHIECQESRDCEEKIGPNARCVVADRPFNVCQFPEESNCNYNSDCPQNQRCSSDRQCRDQCKGDPDCVQGQVCVQGVCAEPRELIEGKLPPPADGREVLPNDGQACVRPSDCVAPLTCLGGLCTYECNEDRDCSRFDVCTNRACVPKPSSAGDCVPTTCATLGKECGVILDGCGGTKQCAAAGASGTAQDCATGQVCGGGGPNKCGTTMCVPKTCAQLGTDCGLVSDGCSGVLYCGVCPSGLTCGGGGDANKCGCMPDNAAACAGKACGSRVNNCGQAVNCGMCPAGKTCGLTEANQCGCAAKTCSGLGITCGTAPDGCGGTLSCGNCTVAGQSCGGAGTPNQCGTGSCAPKTCQQLNACGTVSNGCNATLDCGGCAIAGQTCGGGATANQCGCSLRTCDQAGAFCGDINDGCGGTRNCGSCVSPKTCGGGGTANACGCTQTTCALQGKDCGTIPDGCGGTISCGSCSAGKICGASGVNNVCATPGPIPSCNGTFGATCGPDGNDSCCRSELVVGTTPTESYFRHWKTASPPQARRPAKVSSYKLDVYEVTIGRYRTYLNAANSYAYKTQHPPTGAGVNSNVATTIPGNEAPTWQAGWNQYLYNSLGDATTQLQSCGDGMWTTVPTGGVENHSARCVNWYQAFAFCAWDGGRLPTSTEWEYAQHGGTEYREFPWGNLTTDVCNRDAFQDCPWPVRTGLQRNGDGKWGQRNMQGGLLEWVFDTGPQPQLPDCSGNDCAYSLTVGGNVYRIASGMSWQEYSSDINYYYYPYGHVYDAMDSYGPLHTTKQSNLGFRCARSL